MRRFLATLTAIAALLATAPQAGATATLGKSTNGLLALSAGTGQAYAVLDSGDPAAPYLLVRSTGQGVSQLGRFGVRGARFPDVAVSDGALLVAYGRINSNGLLYESSFVQATGFGIPAPLAQTTGPARIALDGRSPLAAFPDDVGDAVLGGRDAADAPVLQVLSDSAPEHRHAPLDLVMQGALATVLDLVQSSTRSELRVVGPGAPAQAVLSVPGVRALGAALARDHERIYVAYGKGDSVVLASARPTPGAPWSYRRLATRGSLGGAPAVARVGLRTLVATSERVGRRREIYVTTIGPEGTFIRRLTRSPADDLAPQLTVGLDDAVYVGWTRRDGLRRKGMAMLERLR